MRKTITNNWHLSLPLDRMWRRKGAAFKFSESALITKKLKDTRRQAPGRGGRRYECKEGAEGEMRYQCRGERRGKGGISLGGGSGGGKEVSVVVSSYREGEQGSTREVRGTCLLMVSCVKGSDVIVPHM